MEKIEKSGPHKSVSIPIDELAQVLGRSSSFVRVSMTVLKVSMHKNTLSLENAVSVIRYFASKSSDQETLLENITQKLAACERRELELAVAMELLKQERSTLKEQVRSARSQLERSQARNDRLENQLHELTASFAYILSQRDKLVARSKLHSKATLKQNNGHEVLYLEYPVNLHMLGVEDR